MRPMLPAALKRQTTDNSAAQNTPLKGNKTALMLQYLELFPYLCCLFALSVCHSKMLSEGKLCMEQILAISINCAQFPLIE